MMREIEKLFETLKDDFSQKMSNISYFTNYNDSIESHIANAGGSITDSYEDISLGEDETNDSSTEMSLFSHKLLSIDSEPESMPITDDSNITDIVLKDSPSMSIEVVIEDYDVVPTPIIENYILENMKENIQDLKEEGVEENLDSLPTKNENVNIIENEMFHGIQENDNNCNNNNNKQEKGSKAENDNIVPEHHSIGTIINDTQLNMNNTNKCDNKISEKQNILVITEYKQIKQMLTNKDNKTILERSSVDFISDYEEIHSISENEPIDVIAEYEQIDTTPNFLKTEICNCDEVFEKINDNDQMISEDIVEQENNCKLISETMDNNSDNPNVTSDCVNQPINKTDDPCDEEMHIILSHKIMKNFPESKDKNLFEQVRLRKSADGRSNVRKPLKHSHSNRKMWSEMPEVIEAHILTNLPKKILQLQEAMFEIITSEASYYQSLMILTSHFFQSDLFTISDDKENIVSAIDKHHIFSNVILIMKTSQNFLNDLEQRWHDEKPYLISICDVVLRHATSENFQHYVTYLRNQQYQTQALKRLSENEVFKQQLSKLEASAICGKLSLDSYLMLPMQRLTRMKLLVEAVSKLQNCEELCSEIPASTKSITIEALEEIKKLLNTSNTEKGLMDQKGALLSLVNRINFPQNFKRITFSDRVFIREEEFRVHQQTPVKTIRKFSKKKQPLLTLLLFDDLLIISKKKGSKLIVLDYCNIEDVEAWSHESSSNDVSSNTSAIDLNIESNSPLKLISSTLIRSKTSLSADERKRLSVPLNNSFISMPSINKIDDHETKTQTFLLQLSHSHSDIFTNPVFLTAQNREERDLWLSMLNKDRSRNALGIQSKSNPSKLQKSMSLKISTDYPNKTQFTKNYSCKKLNTE